MKLEVLVDDIINFVERHPDATRRQIKLAFICSGESDLLDKVISFLIEKGVISDNG